MRQSDMQVEYRGGERVAFLKPGTTDVNPEAFIQMARESGAVPRDYNGVVETVARDEMARLEVAKIGAEIYSSGLRTSLDVGSRNAIRDAVGLPNLERTADIDADARMHLSVGSSYTDEASQRQARAEQLLREIGK